MNKFPLNINSDQSGFSLIELMVVIAIIGVLAAVAIPSYNSYLWTSRLGTATMNADHLRGFASTYFYEYGAFPTGTYDPGTSTYTFPSALDFNPDGDKDRFKYDIAACPSMTASQCVNITVTYLDDTSVSQTLTLSP